MIDTGHHCTELQPDYEAKLALVEFDNGRIERFNHPLTGSFLNADPHFHFVCQHRHQHVWSRKNRQCHEARRKYVGGHRSAVVQHKDNPGHAKPAKADWQHNAVPVFEPPQTQCISVAAKLHW